MTQQKSPQKYSIQTADPVWLREEADRVIRFFAERLRKVDIVREVRYTYEVGGVTAWVIIDGPRMDFELEKPVHEAIGDALVFQKVALFDFRIINMNELRDGAFLEDIVPEEAELLWKRADA